MNLVRIVSYWAGLALLSVGSASLHAQPYTTKPIRLVLGFPAGGGADSVARMFLPAMEKQLGQSIVIDYRPGAGATLAADHVAKASADGYTLHYIDSGPLTVVPNTKKLGYDPTTAFTPISLVVSGGYVLVAHPSVAASTLRDLLSIARARPGALSFGSSGTGSSGHLAGELLKSIARIDIVHVPYKGGAQSMTDLIGGQIPLLIASLPTAVPQVRAGKIRALGVTTTSRVLALPDTPTFDEQGIDGYDASVWFGLVGPPGLGTDIVTRVRDALLRALDDPVVQAAIRVQGYEVSTSTPAELGERIRRELVKWGKVIQDAGIRVE
ncbi:MAG: Bug family tripartite tricarboxylate transporter substrate binding protein [Burkholderiales bacterium]